MTEKAESLEKYVERFDIKSLIVAMILSALGFLVALSWRDAIQQTIDLLLPQKEGLFYTYVAAVVVTTIAVFITFFLLQIKNKDIIPSKIEKKIKKKVEKRVKKGLIRSFESKKKGQK